MAAFMVMTDFLAPRYPEHSAQPAESPSTKAHWQFGNPAMRSSISAFFSQKHQPQTKTKPAHPTEGHLVLQLLNDHSPALLDALETQNSGALAALLWANPNRKHHAHAKRIQIDQPNPNGDTLWLRTATLGDYPNATQALLRAEAKPDAQDAQGRDALSLHTLLRHPKALQVVLQNAALTYGLEDIRHLFHYGLPPVQVPLSQDNDGNTALLHAVKSQNHDALYQLTKAHAEPNAKNVAGNTALIEAAKQGDTYACCRLLKSKADALTQDAQGKTALMHWLLNGKPKSVLEAASYWLGSKVFKTKGGDSAFLMVSDRLLQESAPQINQQDHWGRTALSYWVDSPWRNSMWGASMLRRLLQVADTNVDLPDHQGLTPLMYFAQIKPKNTFEKALGYTASFADSQDINRQDKQRKTALIHAAENGNLDAGLAILIGNNSQNLLGISPPNDGADVDPNITDDQGKTALMALSALKPEQFEAPAWRKMAGKLYNRVAEQFPEDLPPIVTISYSQFLSHYVQILVLAGANVMQANAGETALMIAAQCGNLPVLKVLCHEHPATMEQKNWHGQSALQLTKLNDQSQAMKILLQAGANPEA
jgi:ankyrin repeat protein